MYTFNPLECPEIISIIVKYLCESDLFRYLDINQAWYDSIRYELFKRLDKYRAEYKQLGLEMEMAEEKGLTDLYFIYLLKVIKYRVMYSGLNIVKMIFVNPSNGFPNGKAPRSLVYKYNYSIDVMYPGLSPEHLYLYITILTELLNYSISYKKYYQTCNLRSIR
jgi:hypothetical protein